MTNLWICIAILCFVADFIFWCISRKKDIGWAGIRFMSPIFDICAFSILLILIIIHFDQFSNGIIPLICDPIFIIRDIISIVRLCRKKAPEIHT